MPPPTKCRFGHQLKTAFGWFRRQKIWHWTCIRCKRQFSSKEVRRSASPEYERWNTK